LNNTVTALVVVIVFLSAGFVGISANLYGIHSQYGKQLNEKSDVIDSLSRENAALSGRVDSLSGALDSSQEQNRRLSSWLAGNASALALLANEFKASFYESLKANVSYLQGSVSSSRSDLKVLVFHVSEKGDGYEWGRLPDVQGTYRELRSVVNRSYDLLLLPEYCGHLNWSEELGWLDSNFGGQGGIPVMLDVLGGFNASVLVPNLSLVDVSAAMGVCNVKWLRVAEVLSWSEENSQSFPVAHVREILDFARGHGLKVFWTEWKSDVFGAVWDIVRGYEDVVTVSFSTNSQDLSPLGGFLMVEREFWHWGASVQAWYWDTYSGGDVFDMPVGLFWEHSLAAKWTGAEVLEFEPYWYLFDNGSLRDSAKVLLLLLG
jgi:hypothetical protein